MKRAILPLSLVAATFLLTACPNAEDDDNIKELPDEPIGFSLKWFEDGGMLNQSTEAYVSADSAYWTFDRYGESTTIRWIPTEEEINELYADLKEQEFDKITTTCEGEVFDRGGFTFYIDIDGDFYEIVNSGHCFVDEKWHTNYQEFSNAAFDFFKGGVEQAKLTVEVSASEEAMNSGYGIQVENDFIAYQGPKNINADTLAQNLWAYPGINRFTVKFNYPDSSDRYGNPVFYKYEEIFLPLDNDGQKVQINWTDEKIGLETF